MGAASSGPLIVGRKEDSVQFFDLSTLKPIPIPETRDVYVYKDWRVRASADGRVFTSLMENWSVVWRFTETGVEVSKVRFVFGQVPVPGPDGRWLDTTSVVYGSGGMRVAGAAVQHRYCLPAVHGPYFASFTFGREFVREQPVGVSLHRAPDWRTFATPAGIAFGYKVGRFDYGRLATDRRFILIPQAKLIITIPSSSDRLVLHRFDPEEALKRFRMGPAKPASR